MQAFHVLLCKQGRGAADAAEAKSTVFVTGISDLLAAVTLGEHNEAAALCTESIDIPIHAPAGGGPH